MSVSRGDMDSYRNTYFESGGGDRSRTRRDATKMMTTATSSEAKAQTATTFPTPEPSATKQTLFRIQLYFGSYYAFSIHALTQLLNGPRGKNTFGGAKGRVKQQATRSETKRNSKQYSNFVVSSLVQEPIAHTSTRLH
jgi:hypothetical protein